MPASVAPSQPNPPQPFVVPDLTRDVPAESVPLYTSIFAWIQEHLANYRLGRPFRKRLAVLVTGLVAADHATRGDLTAVLHGLHITAASAESIDRRLSRILDDARLDPGVLLRMVLRTVVHRFLAPLEAAGTAPHNYLRLALDESTFSTTHVLVVGLILAGTVLPLAIRSWTQNAPLPEGAYWAHLLDACADAAHLLPAFCRSRVLLVADRAYAIPRLLDLLHALQWHWVLRAQGQILVRGVAPAPVPLRTLVPQPGSVWTGGPTTDLDTPDTLAVFKGAHWRPAQIVAAWAVGEAEPWLLLTNLPANLLRLRDYALRWAVERLFLAWKTHGWDLAATGITNPVRFARLLTGVVLATWWRIAIALPVAQAFLADLFVRTAHRPPRPIQLRLPLDDAPPTRPYPAKFSLLTLGRRALAGKPLQSWTPARSWHRPAWPDLPWSALCQLLYHPPADSF